MYEFFPNYVLRPLYPPMHGVPGSSQRKGIRTGSATEFYVDASHAKANDDNKGWDADFPLKTIQRAVNNAKEGDWIIIMPGTYEESVLVNKGLTLIGRGGCDAVVVAPVTATTNAPVLVVTASKVTLIGIGFVGEATSPYAVGVGDKVGRFRAYNSMFNCATGDALRLTGNNNVLLENCVIVNAENGVAIIDGASGAPDGIIIRNCTFATHSAAHIDSSASAVKRLMISDCLFDGSTVPTKFLDLDGVGSTGIVTRCSIGYATNATAVIDLADGVLWVANYTEAGITATRPA